MGTAWRGLGWNGRMQAWASCLPEFFLASGYGPGRWCGYGMDWTGLAGHCKHWQRSWINSCGRVHPPIHPACLLARGICLAMAMGYRLNLVAAGCCTAWTGMVRYGHSMDWTELDRDWRIPASIGPHGRGAGLLHPSRSRWIDGVVRRRDGIELWHDMALVRRPAESGMGWDSAMAAASCTDTWRTARHCTDWAERAGNDSWVRGQRPAHAHTSVSNHSAGGHGAHGTAWPGAACQAVEAYA